MSVVAAVALQDCGDDMLGCALIRCDTGAMVDKDDSVIIQIRSRVYTNTLILVGLARSLARTHALQTLYSLYSNNNDSNGRQPISCFLR